MERPQNTGCAWTGGQWRSGLGHFEYGFRLQWPDAKANSLPMGGDRAAQEQYCKAAFVAQQFFQFLEQR